MKKDKKKIIKVMDIVPVSKKSRKKNKKEEIEMDDIFEEEINPDREEEEKDFFEEINSLKKYNNKDTGFFSGGKSKKKKIKLSRKKKVIRYGIISLVVVLVVYIAAVVLPKVTITIVEQKKSWNFVDSVVVSTKINDIYPQKDSIPGEIFEQEKNVVLSFNATSEKYVERKASGEITIYNDYSSSPQALVASTRFETSDGKIYRIVDKVTVPGAKIVGGEIEPSSITVKAVADKAGEEYNIGPVSKFTIPGFEGSDKFEGFYGSSSGSMTGGFIGESLYPSDEDIELAEEGVESQLTDALKMSLTTQIPDGFKVVDGSQEIEIINIDVNEEVKNDGKFSVVGEGVVKSMIFKEANLLEMLRLKGLDELELNESFVEKEKEIKYSQPLVEWEDGKMTLPLEYSAVFWSPVTEDKIKEASIGKSAVNLKTEILAMPYIEKLTVSFWPFWVKKVPNRESRIIINIE